MPVTARGDRMRRRWSALGIAVWISVGLRAGRCADAARARRRILWSHEDEPARDHQPYPRRRARERRELQRAREHASCDRGLDGQVSRRSLDPAARKSNCAAFRASTLPRRRPRSGPLSRFLAVSSPVQIQRLTSSVYLRFLSLGVTQVPEARQTTAGGSRTSAALSPISGRAAMTLRASNSILRDVLPVCTMRPSASM